MSSQSNSSILNDNNNSNTNNINIDSDSQEEIEDQDNVNSGMSRRRIKKVGKRNKKGSKSSNRKLKYPSKLSCINLFRQTDKRFTN